MQARDDQERAAAQRHSTSSVSAGLGCGALVSPMCYFGEPSHACQRPKSVGYRFCLRACRAISSGWQGPSNFRKWAAPPKGKAFFKTRLGRAGMSTPRHRNYPFEPGLWGVRVATSSPIRPLRLRWRYEGTSNHALKLARLRWTAILRSIFSRAAPFSIFAGDP
jgi:hypothetical protein